MAISNLVTPGQTTERPSVSSFFGQSNANTSTEKVSSSMLSDSFIDSTVNMLKGLSDEIARIQNTAKKTLAGFDKIINSIRELNRSITMRFKSLNSELTASRVDFLRGVLNAPEQPTPELGGGSPVIVMKNDQPAAATPAAAPSAPTSLLDMLTSAAGEAALTQTITKLFSGGSFLSSILPLIFNPATLAAGGFLALAYFAGKARAENPEGWLDFQLKMRSGAERAKVITGPEEETKKYGPVQESGVIAPGEVLKRNKLTKEDVASSKGNIVTLKDGRWFDTTSKSDKLQSPETNPNKTKGSTPTVSSTATPAEAVAAPASTPGATSVSTASSTSSSMPAAAPSAVPTNSAAPSVMNSSPGSASSTGAPTIKPAPPATPLPAISGNDPEAAPTGAPTRGSLRNSLDKSIPVNPLENSGSTNNDANSGNLKAGNVGGVDEKSANAETNSIQSKLGITGSAEKVKADAGNLKAKNIGGVDADQQGMQPDVVPNSQDSKPSQLSISSGTPSLNSNANPNSMLNVDSAERMIETKVIQMAEVIRMQSSNKASSNQPIVMNNTTTSNSSSSEGGEGNNVSGQNFPLSAINPLIQEFLAKQNVNYQ